MAHSLVGYSIDSGSSDLALGPGNVTLTDFMWLNGFQTVLGGEVINSIDVAIGSNCAFGCKNPNPLGIEVYLYDDPTNDMNPTDAVLLTGTSKFIQADLGDSFVPVAINPTIVSGAFFVSVLIRDAVANSFPVPIENLGYASGQTWLVKGADGVSGSINETDLSGAFVPNGGAWTYVALLRAGAAEVVPEPPPFFLFIMGLLFVIFLTHKRVHRTP